MTERLTPEQVARLDPFGVREIPASKELAKLLGEKEVSKSPWKSGEVILHYEGECHEWCSHPEGVIIHKDNKFLLNGKELLYQGDFVRWFSHPKGIIIQTKGVIFSEHDQFWLNGKKLLCREEFFYDDGFSSIETRKIQEANPYISSRGILYEIEERNWGFPFRETVFQEGNQLVLVGDKGEKLLYQGEFDSWCSHPEGVIIRKGDDWIFYGKES